MADSQDSEHSGSRPSNKGRPRGAAPWPRQARALAENIQDAFERVAENSMRVTNHTKEIDNLVNCALAYSAEGKTDKVQESLLKIIAKTSMVRHDEADTFLWMIEMAKRLALSMAGKYKQEGE